MIRVVVLSVISVVVCFPFTNRAVGEDSGQATSTTSLVLTCVAVPDSDANPETRDMQFFALFREDDANKLTWDVTVNEKSTSVLITGMLQAKVQWDLTEANQADLDSLLKQVHTNQYRPIVVLAEGVWGEFVPSAHWPRQQRQLVVRSVRETELGLKPAFLRYKQIESERLRGYSDRALLAEYQRVGAKLLGTPYAPGAWPPPASPVYDAYTKSKLDDFGSIRQEIVRRGGAIVPSLSKLLRREINKPRARTRTKREAEFLGSGGSYGFNDDFFDKSGKGLSSVKSPHPTFAVDLLRVLGAIGDPRSAKLSLDIASGFDGKATARQQRAAVDCLQRLTYISLRKMGPYDGGAGLIIEHPIGTKIEYGDGYHEQQVEFFRKWLEGEGQNSANWLPLARLRARMLMDSKDPGHVFRGAQFLRPIGHDRLRGGLYETGHDDDPKRTMDRLAERMATFETHGVNFYWKKNYQVPGDRAAWVQLFTNHGTLARKHASLVIRHRLHDNQLLPVGGDEILEYLFERMDAVSDSKVWIHQIIDRWAGRHFESDEARKAWWQDNRHLSDEERMRASLPLLVAQSDERKAEANHIVETILPDAPAYYQRNEAGNYEPGPSRVTWLKENIANLRFDAQRGRFLLVD